MFRHSTPVSLRFSDMDAFGHINNANFLTYIEEARIKYFNEIVHWNYDWSKNGIILARIEIDYKIPLNFKDEVIVFTRCIKIGIKSITMDYELIKKDGENKILFASAKSVLVMFNYEKNNSIPVSDDWKSAISKFEGTSF